MAENGGTTGKFSRQPTLVTQKSNESETASQEHNPKLPPIQTMEAPRPLTSKDANPVSPRFSNSINPFTRHNSLDLDDYFTGPRDLSRHSKWPMFMRMHGSILPKMILPLLFVGAWSTVITIINQLINKDFGVDSVLLTVTGFIVSLSLSFRSSTAYERYAEGRRYWGMLTNAANALGRVFWIHSTDPEGMDKREAMLKKLNSMNLVVAFSIALKHSLRFEPYTAYNDIYYLVGHLNTFAKEATNAQPELIAPKKSFFKEMGEYLGVSFAASNPRKALKKTDRPLGNLPVEILNHLAMAVDQLVRNGQIDIPMQQTLAYNHIAMLNDILTGCERVLSTPLPLAYAIAISQITWVYIMLLPFQLVLILDWVTIPATMVAAYIILGFLMIGEEIENPFGEDVNDLPLESYCEQIAADMDIIASYEKRDGYSFLNNADSIPLYPASSASMGTWMRRDEESLRSAIKGKPQKTFTMRKNRDGDEPNSAEKMV
ncbi:hypothetical protein N3K66_001770 [Trichothecium roseum]|uniref:Uncharacterized protein n=1 Tax=Trichothecium roseum TaxID=47278 RepID=A0ACC0V9G6_9HYPO|nr:hypothetical protein N3K66_001770 [Trichothecium roseum]